MSFCSKWFHLYTVLSCCCRGRMECQLILSCQETFLYSVKLLRSPDLTKKKKKRSFGFTLPIVYHSLFLPIHTSYENDLGPSYPYFLEWTLRIWGSLDQDLFPLFEEPPLFASWWEAEPTSPKRSWKAYFPSSLEIRHRQMICTQPFR